MTKQTLAARTFLAAIVLAALAKLAGFNIGLDYVLTFIMEAG